MSLKGTLSIAGSCGQATGNKWKKIKLSSLKFQKSYIICRMLNWARKDYHLFTVTLNAESMDRNQKFLSLLAKLRGNEPPGEDSNFASGAF